MYRNLLSRKNTYRHMLIIVGKSNSKLYIHAGMYRALVPVANGSEDIETSSIVDILRRAQFHGTNRFNVLLFL